MQFKCKYNRITLDNNWIVKVASCQQCQLFISRGQFSQVMCLTDESSVGSQELPSVLSMWCDVLDDWARVNTLHCKVRGLTNNSIMWHWQKAKHNQLKVIHRSVPWEAYGVQSLQHINKLSFCSEPLLRKAASLSFFVQHTSLFVTFNDWC